MTKFPLGQVVATPNALGFLASRSLTPMLFLERHAAGDWGDVCEEDREMNEISLRNHYRLVSVYKIGDEAIWIVTEADRSVTTVLLPEDY